MGNKLEIVSMAEPVLDRTHVKIDELTIGMHAIDAFCSRTGSEFSTAPDAIRSRLKTATLFAHFTKGRASWHFQDPENPNIFYVVMQEMGKRRQTGFFLATVRNAEELKFKL